MRLDYLPHQPSIKEGRKLYARNENKPLGSVYEEHIMYSSTKNILVSAYSRFIFVLPFLDIPGFKTASENDLNQIPVSIKRLVRTLKKENARI